MFSDSSEKGSTFFRTSLSEVISAENPVKTYSLNSYVSCMITQFLDLKSFYTSLFFLFVLYSCIIPPFKVECLRLFYLFLDTVCLVFVHMIAINRKELYQISLFASHGCRCMYDRRSSVYSFFLFFFRGTPLYFIVFLAHMIAFPQSFYGYSLCFQTQSVLFCKVFFVHMIAHN